MHEHTDNYVAGHWEKASVVVNQHRHEHSHPQPVSQVAQSRQSYVAADMSPSASQPKSFTATEMEILLRQDRSSYVSKASIPSLTSPTKLPYIVRRKKNGQR